jgi:hypothetical protein
MLYPLALKLKHADGQIGRVSPVCIQFTLLKECITENYIGDVRIKIKVTSKQIFADP